MRADVVAQLLAINRQFYEQFATSFHTSRLQPAYGFFQLLRHLPAHPLTVLDVGCGNGRWGHFLHQHGRVASYIGIDNSPSYMDKGREWVSIQQNPHLFRFRQGEMAHPDFLADLPTFQLVACLSALHHVPTRQRRYAVVRELAAHLDEAGQLVLGSWQFMDSPRQRRKILDWRTVGLSEQDVEKGDYLMRWQRGGWGQRYVALIDESETAALAAAANLRVIHQFRDDGREGNLNLYTILQKRQYGTMEGITEGVNCF